MNPETNPSEVFSPLPVRSRGILEMLDASIKLYKQYFLILIGWSSAATLAVGLCQVVGLAIPGLAFVMSALANVLPLGATVCCIAAAVRGQRVTFKQCWQFTKPRYWPLVGVSVLAKLILGFAALVVAGVGGVIGAAGYYGVSNASAGAQIAAGIIGLPILLAVVGIPLVLAYMWQGMVAIVICMEDNNRNANALGRAYDLMRQNWMRTISLMTMFSLLMLIFFGFIAFGLYITNALPQFKDILDGREASSAFYKDLSIMGVAVVVLSIVYEPWNCLILSLLYLDIRVRKEALDLEWSAHVTAPQIDPATAASQAFGGPTDFGQAGQFSPTFSANATHVWATAPSAAANDVAASAAAPDLYAAAASPAPSVTVAPLPVKCQLCGVENPVDLEYCAACGARTRPGS